MTKQDLDDHAWSYATQGGDRDGFIADMVAEGADADDAASAWELALEDMAAAR